MRVEIREMKVDIGSDPDQSKDFAIMIAMTSLNRKLWILPPLADPILTQISFTAANVHRKRDS